MSENNSKFSTLSDIRGFITKAVIVQGYGLKLRLTPPTASAALDVREQMFSTVGDKPQAGTLLKATALAVKAGLAQKLTLDESMRLVLRMGGENGPLAKEALKLCGLGHMLSGFDENLEEKDPNPFSSREPQAVM